MQPTHRALRRESYQAAKDYKPHGPPVDAREASDNQLSQRRAALQLYAAGWKLKELSRLYGISMDQVFRLLFHQLQELRRQHKAGAPMAKLTRQSGLLPAEVRAIVGS